MYEVVKSCVKQCGTMSDFYDCAVGLRQGEVISPILVSLFLQDIEAYFQSNSNTGLDIGNFTLTLLLFADDMVLFGKDPDELQKNLDIFHSYCCKWGLEVNCSKTKIAVFRNRGNIHTHEKWFYNNNEIDIVDSFNYLGVIFNYTGSFAKNNDYVVGKALKALSAFMYNCRSVPIRPNLLCQLFDAFVGSVLSYSADVWGFTKCKNIERVHLKFCKKLLNVRMRSS